MSTKRGSFVGWFFIGLLIKEWGLFRLFVLVPEVQPNVKGFLLGLLGRVVVVAIVILVLIAKYAS